MNASKLASLIGTAAMLLLGWACSRSQPAQVGMVSMQPMTTEIQFGWRNGRLLKHDGKWHFLPADSEVNGVANEIRAFPWLAIGVRPGTSNNITPFPLYPRDKYERDGHHYPVGKNARWFGAICREEKEFEEYAALMLTIKGQIGEDPPGQKPTFEGPGFYIVTAY
ncbi:MAG: hypothetical protein ACK5CW_01400 [Verrucomicrobiota bacterium]|jgi:hypothetical protein